MVIYAVMMVLILFPGIPEQAANLLLALCAAAIIFACVMYCRFYRDFLAEKLKSQRKKAGWF